MGTHLELQAPMELSTRHTSSKHSEACGVTFLEKAAVCRKLYEITSAMAMPPPWVNVWRYTLSLCSPQVSPFLPCAHAPLGQQPLVQSQRWPLASGEQGSSPAFFPSKKSALGSSYVKPLLVLYHVAKRHSNLHQLLGAIKSFNP